MLTIFINILFALGMLIHVSETKKLRASSTLPSRMDYIYSVLCGVVGAVMISSFMTVMTTNPVEGITDAIVGLSGIILFVWSLTIYKRIKWENGL